MTAARRSGIAISVAVIIVSASAFWLTLSKAVLYSAGPDTASAAVAGTGDEAGSPIPSPGLPLRLSIPSLGIDAAIQRTGISAKGNMGVPTNFTDAAWYVYGPKPGQSGDAVIDGHVDNGLGLAGVFKHLGNIATGTEIYVSTDTGRKIPFMVTDIQSYDYHDVPVQQIFTSEGPASLVLITCDGDWVHGGDTYDRRLVVTAVLDLSYPQAAP